MASAHLLVGRRASATRAVLPGQEVPAWVAGTARPIHGERGAVVANTFVTDTREGIDYAGTHGRSLVAIHVAHGRPDCFFDLKMPTGRRPDARAIAPA